MWMLTQIVALDTSGTVYYTPWFPKGADNGVFTMEKTIDNLATAPVSVTVYTKNAEDEGSAPGSAVGTFSTLSGAFHEVNCTGLKDLVRFVLNFRASAAGQGAVFRFLAPTWYDTAI